MDPVSLTAAAIALLSALAKTTTVVTDFIRNSRGAEEEITSVLQEITTLQHIIDPLSHEGAVPVQFHTVIRESLFGCGQVLDKIRDLATRHDGQSGAVGWALRGRRRVEDLRKVLHQQSSTLTLALNYIDMSSTQDLRSEVQLGLKRVMQAIEVTRADIRHLERDVVAAEYEQPDSPSDLRGYLQTLQDVVDSVEKSVTADEEQLSFLDVFSQLTNVNSAENDPLPRPDSGLPEASTAPLSRELRQSIKQSSRLWVAKHVSAKSTKLSQSYKVPIGVEVRFMALDGKGRHIAIANEEHLTVFETSSGKQVFATGVMRQKRKTFFKSPPLSAVITGVWFLSTGASLVAILTKSLDKHGNATSQSTFQYFIFNYRDGKMLQKLPVSEESAIDFIDLKKRVVCWSSSRGTLEDYSLDIRTSTSFEFLPNRSFPASIEDQLQIRLCSLRVAVWTSLVFCAAMSSEVDGALLLRWHVSKSSRNDASTATLIHCVCTYPELKGTTPTAAFMGKKLAISVWAQGKTNYLLRWDVKNNETFLEHLPHDYVLVSPSGRYVACWGQAGLVLLDGPSGTHLTVLRKPLGHVAHAVFGSGETMLALYSQELNGKEVLIYSIEPVNAE